MATEKEIETIKERKITVNLSDADCDRLANLCGEHNITIAKLMESFIKDLVDERYTIASYPEETFLSWLLRNGYDVQNDLLEVIIDIEYGYAELEDYRNGVSELNEEEIERLKKAIKEWEEEIAEIKKNYFKGKEVDWEKEVETVRQWWKAKECFKNGDGN